MQNDVKAGYSAPSGVIAEEEACVDWSLGELHTKILRTADHRLRHCYKTRLASLGPSSCDLTMLYCDMGVVLVRSPGHTVKRHGGRLEKEQCLYLGISCIYASFLAVTS